MDESRDEGRLLLRVGDGVARIEIHNPGKRNAMTGPMWRRLPLLLAELAADPAVHVVVLTGSGDTFCAGADIAGLISMRPASGVASAAQARPGSQEGEPSRDRTLGDPPREDVVLRAEAALFAFPKPTVAVIDGFCIGGGCQLAVGCDLRLATDRARFAITPAKLGIVYPASSLTRLTALIGPSAAKLLLFTADLISADHALRIGLVDEVRPVADLPLRLRELTAALAARSQLTVHAAKDVIDMIAAGRSPDGRAAYWDDVARTSGETAEGIAAFLERRAPVFPWRPFPSGDGTGR